MQLTKHTWRYPTSPPVQTEDELETFSKPFQSILFQRGISNHADALNFLLPKEQPWYGSIYLRDVQTAIDLITEAISAQHKIAIYGDYDADGITSTALLCLALRKITNDVITLIPDRFSTGYGLNKEIIDTLHTKGVDLLITADNGIRSIEEISYANSLGLSVIITDHHEPDNALPNASAIINPKMPDDPYPNKNLAGVGVSYKLVCSLSEHFPEIDPSDYLDLVALGTVADVVPLTGENRFLVRQGLREINRKQRQGLVSLLGVSNLLNRKITSSDISFQIAPRLNASGRLNNNSSSLPLQLFLSDEPSVCASIAQELEINNTERKLISHELQQKIEGTISDPGDIDPIIFAIDEDYHLGVAGIVAGYLVRKYYLPAIVGQVGETHTTASCRSIPEVNIINVLDECSHLFTRYGGHSQAAGFTIENKKTAQLAESLITIVRERLDGKDLHPSLSIDAIIELDEINPGLFHELEKLEPTGSENQRAVFVSKKLTAHSIQQVGRNSDHLKMIVSNGGTPMDAIGFGMGNLRNSIPSTFDLAYHLTVNEYKGRKSFQLHVIDIKLS